MSKKIFLTYVPITFSANAQQKCIYIANDDHTDYMWTGDEEEYRRAFVEMLDYYLDLADKTKDNPTEFQSRWQSRWRIRPCHMDWVRCGLGRARNTVGWEFAVA